MDQLFSTNLGYALVLLAVFGGVLSALLGVRSLMGGRRNVLQDRVQRAVGRQLTREGDQRGALGVWAAAFKPLSKVATPTDAVELGQIRTKLSHAGYKSAQAMYIFLGCKVALSLVLGGVVLWVNSIRPQPIPHALLFTLVAMTIGFYMPNAWLSGRIQERQTKLGRGLPDALDLLVTCVEAGLGLDAALNRVAAEIRLSTPLLSDELATTSAEIRAGISRGDAFRRLSERTGLEELRALSAIIMQTQMFGTSIAKSLRTQSDAMRTRRMQHAEERAATAGVKMTIPLIMCIMPSLFAILLGPAAVKIIRVLMPTLVGGGP